MSETKVEYIKKMEVLEITAETGALETQGRVMRLPTADVRPVVRGHWVRAETPGLMKCSECGRYATHSEILEWDYCNCGADMREA